VDCRLKPAVDLPYLWCVPRFARCRLRLHILDAADEPAVACHNVRAEPVDLARGHIRACQRSPEDAIEVVQVLVELVEGAIDFAALIEDGIGVVSALVIAVHLVFLKMSEDDRKQVWLEDIPSPLYGARSLKGLVRSSTRL